MPSVKEILVDEPPDGGVGRGRFRFTDAYSVFDWGQMPDRIPQKGASLATMGAHTFEMLEASSIPTHYRGVIPPASEKTTEPISLSSVSRPPTQMAIDLVDVPSLPHDGAAYDYEAFHAAAGDAFLVPLEVVFRNEVPVTSSLRKRRDPGDVGLDLPAWPDRPVTLESPIVEFSTKFEHSDRYLDRSEAERIAGPATLADLEAIAERVNRQITERAATVGLTHLDGKIECLYADGTVQVADVAGTFDENRFTHDGVQVSKESLRRYYRRTQPEWVSAIEAAKSAAREAGDPNWRDRCERSPEPLPEPLVTAAGALYAAGTNRYIDRELLDAPSLPEAIDRIERLSREL